MLSFDKILKYFTFYLSTGADDKTLCLKHSFCFHSKYELTQPFPIFCPRIQLKCDGQVILNTGDSIVALHVDLDHVESKPKGPFRENASTLKIRESTSANKNSDNLCVSPEPNKEFVWSASGAISVPCSQEMPAQEVVIEGSVNQKLELLDLAPPGEICDSESQKENTSSNTIEVRIDRTKSPKSPKNFLSQNQKSPTHPLSPADNWLECRNITYPTSPTPTIANQSNLRRARAGSSNGDGPITKDLYNFDSDDSEDSYSFMCPSVPRFSLKSKSSNSQDINISFPPNPVISPNMHLQRQLMQGLTRSSPLNNNSQALNCLPFDSPGVIAARNHPAIQRSFFSPSNSENSFGGTSSSADSVIVQVNDSRTVTHSWRKFSYHGDTAVDSTLVIEGIYTWLFGLCITFGTLRLNIFNSLPNNKILDWSKLKEFADNNINATEKLELVLGRVENIVGKGENAGYQHFLLFPQCFQKAYLLGSLKVRIVR